MPRDSIRYLIEQYLNGQLTEAQEKELLQLTNAGSDEEVLAILQELMQEESLKAVPVDAETLHASLHRVLDVDKKRHRPARVHFLKTSWLRYAAAAIFIIAVGTAVVVFLTNRKAEQSLANSNNHLQNDVPPGGNRAVLTLANGQKIILDSAANGTLAQQGSATITKLSTGQLAYKSNKNNGSEVLYNTMSTPRGGQYKLTLPDGTDVWLNAASSITYPTSFAGTERDVSMSGEAYFEVAKNKAMPFRVKVNDMTVEVLGTHFNVMAYDDDTVVKTTLLEGSVKLVKGKEHSLLKPGEQAQSGSQQQIKIVEDADLGQVMAWKNGLFNFEGADLKTVMQQLSRWYDIDVRYEGTLPVRSFRGKITRDLNLSQVIKLLQDVGVKFRIQGRTLIVMS